MRIKKLSGILVIVSMSVVAQAGAQGRGNEKHDEKGKSPSQNQQGNGSSTGKQQYSARLSQPQQELRITQQQQRGVQYDQHLGQQRNIAQQRSVKLKQQHRTNQYQFQLLYIERLNQQHLVIQNNRSYNYAGDPYFHTASTYRYSRGGRSYETNQYGVDLLRRAVNYGYDEGFRSGSADRHDRWAFSYADSFAYQDANFGYAGYYVERDDYNYYFREGFRRGYDDGFYSRRQYGLYANGSYSVLAPTLSVILNFQAIR